MPINVFGNSSDENSNKIDTSLIVQKPYLKHNCIEANIEEDLELRNQYRIKNYLILLVLENQFRKILLIIYSTFLV